MNNHPSISIDTPASRLVTVDSLYLRLMYDRIQDIYRDTDHLATALDAIKTKDEVSQGVLVAVKAALYANSELAGIVSDMFCDHALPYQAEATSHE
ncbi:hypothetical protein CXF56_09870 [Psychrobacter sp. Choline-02u-13]|uniref:hypothetical protein n=1 Tax=unclassified Psychrobacter TaxID=196806 RepID=UPI000C79C92F|nr:MULTISPECIES: hypothetical protein [unclassified Psychrobacter]PKG64526.1 hypothetical protein CXF56_09870 [Psychrobacter sp. Choline-02u-13]PKH48706.1 hypothetical protein CXF69_10390 [Psychrobacter sp. Choline-02u-9]